MPGISSELQSNKAMAEYYLPEHFSMIPRNFFGIHPEPANNIYYYHLIKQQNNMQWIHSIG